MDQTHIHLLITHLPIFGSLLGTLVLGYGIWKKTTQRKRQHIISLLFLL